MSGTSSDQPAGLGDPVAWDTSVQPGVPDTRQVLARRADGMPASQEERYLRRLLASRSGIPQLYRDDGEASGYAEGIAIDFMRDTAAELATKLQGHRGCAIQEGASMTDKQPQPHGGTLVPYEGPTDDRLYDVGALHYYLAAAYEHYEKQVAAMVQPSFDIATPQFHDPRGLDWSDAEAAQPADTEAQVHEVLPPCRVADVGFRFDPVAIQHVPTLLLEFEPVPTDGGPGAKGWRERDAMASAIRRLVGGGSDGTRAAPCRENAAANRCRNAVYCGILRTAG